MRVRNVCTHGNAHNCGHALKVMDYVGVREIPNKHILRWTRDARDVLPENLRHYQLDQAAGLFKENLAVMAPFEETRDDLGS